MARHGRPSRLLNLQKSPASNKAIAAQNATTSSFLKLPPEIRQRIYGFALGGRTLHVASGAIFGPNSVVVCLNPDDYRTGLDQQVIRDGTVGLRDLPNRGRSHMQLESHKECYKTQDTWSLDLLGVCRQIYHEAVLVPFKKNTFAAVEGIGQSNARPLFANFLDHLIPAQVKAIRHVILQGFRIFGARRPMLSRLKGLQLLEYVLVIEHHWFDMPSSWPEYCEEHFSDRKIGSLGLPQSCDVKIGVRKYLERMPFSPTDTDQLPEELMQWVKDVEKRVRA